MPPKATKQWKSYDCIAFYNHFNIKKKNVSSSNFEFFEVRGNTNREFLLD